MTPLQWSARLLAKDPVKVSTPGPIYSKLMKTTRSLGYTKRGQRWKLLDFLLDYADTHPDLFRKR